MDLLVLFILIGLMNIAGLFAFCVGIVVSNAVGMCAMAVVYNRLATPGRAYLREG